MTEAYIIMGVIIALQFSVIIFLLSELSRIKKIALEMLEVVDDFCADASMVEARHQSNVDSGPRDVIAVGLLRPEEVMRAISEAVQNDNDS